MEKCDDASIPSKLFVQFYNVTGAFQFKVILLNAHWLTSALSDLSIQLCLCNTCPIDSFPLLATLPPIEATTQLSILAPQNAVLEMPSYLNSSEISIKYKMPTLISHKKLF